MIKHPPLHIGYVLLIHLKWWATRKGQNVFGIENTVLVLLDSGPIPYEPTWGSDGCGIQASMLGSVVGIKRAQSTTTNTHSPARLLKITARTSLCLFAGAKYIFTA